MQAMTVAVKRRGTNKRRPERHPFEPALQTANVWLNDVREKLGGRSAADAYHALRDRLSVNEAADLGAQFPLLIRGIYYEGWRPAGKPLKERHKSQFIAHVARELPEEPFSIDLERITRGVLRVLSQRVSDGEIADVKATLPAAVRELWG